jgi:hypothetical protein
MLIYMAGFLYRLGCDVCGKEVGVSANGEIDERGWYQAGPHWDVHFCGMGCWYADADHKHAWSFHHGERQLLKPGYRP